jgi:hypothetical protein
MALGFAAVRDEVFRALVLGRIVEPTSKLDTVRVLGGLGGGPAVAGDVHALPQPPRAARLPNTVLRGMLSARDPDRRAWLGL